MGFGTMDCRLGFCTLAFNGPSGDLFLFFTLLAGIGEHGLPSEGDATQETEGLPAVGAFLASEISTSISS